MKKNVLEWLEDAVASHPDKIAYQDESNSLTFKNTYRMARSVGSALAAIADEKPIIVFTERSIITIVAYFGVVYSGHAYAPIDPSLPMDRVATIINTLQPSAIVITRANVEKLEPLLDEMDEINVYIFEDVVESPIDDNVLKAIRRTMVSTDPLYVIFTSGSTGKPKGVITSHLSLMLYIKSYSKVMNIDGSDCLGNQSPLDYIAAIRDIYLPLLTGCRTIIIPKSLFMQPGRLFDFLNTNSITAVGWSVSVFTLLTRLHCFEEDKIESLKKVCFSGSVMPGKCLKVWQEQLPEAMFVNQYGPTEATASCTYYIIDHIVDESECIPIGIPYENYHVFLMDENMNHVSKGSIGEICISGPILALGYYNDAEKTNESFVYVQRGYPERVYKTGDYGRIREDGIFEFHGRKDRQIKYMGHRVELDEVEGTIGGISGISEGVVLYDAKKEQLVLVYSGTIEKKALILELRKKLPDFMVPRNIVYRDSLPKLSNGKYDYKKMEDAL